MNSFLGMLILTLTTFKVPTFSPPEFSENLGVFLEEISQMSSPRAVHQATLLESGEVLV